MARQPYQPPRIDHPPFYTLEPNGSIADFVASGSRGRRGRGAAVPAEIVASKGSRVYRAHTYHTKVPPEGIAAFIKRYAHPGAVVLDPFCGSGMTGVAAIESGRRAVLVDLSPAATFIASNYCERPDPEKLRREAERVVAAVAPALEPLYTTRCRTCGGKASIRFTVWSDRYACPECGHEFLLWDVARRGRRVAAGLACPACGREGHRGLWTRLEPEPVLIKYSCDDACGGGEDSPEPDDLVRARRRWPDRVSYPRTPIPAQGDEIARVHNQGISRVDQLFTPRNLRAIATLWHTIGSLPDLECRRQLFFCLTGSMPRASRTNKYIPALGIAPGPILGTMYIPGFHPELNVLALFGRKVADVVRYYRGARPIAGPADAVRISTQSATDLSNIPDGSIDYAFTDPPFGSNIAYSELNLLWESWLGARTHVPDEAVVSRTQSKSVDDYQGMMVAAFAEVRRVLKPGGHFSIVFHNTSGEVWRALQAAIDDAALAIESTVIFDKGPNQSFKQFTSEGAVTHDLVVTCRRRRRGEAPLRDASEGEVVGFVRKAAAASAKATPRKLYSATVAHFLREGVRVPVGFREFRALLRHARDKET